MSDLSLERPRILYFADTMCSWCYGFAPQMNAVLAALGGEVDLLLFAGGLRPFTKEPVDARTRAYLAATWAKIGDLTSQPFADGAVLGEGFVYDTEPASRAVVTIRAIAPGQEYAYMHRVQRAFYAGGEDVTKAVVLASHAEAQGVDRARFVAAFDSPEMREATLGDFQVAQRFGIDGFPTLVVHRNSGGGGPELILVGKGYATADEVIDRIRQAIAPA